MNLNEEFYSYDVVYHRTDENKLISSGYHNSRKYVDPFWKDEYWFSSKILKRYFKTNYNLNHYQVWNLLNNHPIDKKFYCKQCDEELGFNFSSGPGNFCSYKCELQYQKENNKEFVEANRLSSVKSITNYNKTKWNDPETYARLSKIVGNTLTKYNESRKSLNIDEMYQFYISRTYRCEIARFNNSDRELRYFYISRFSNQDTGFKVGLHYSSDSEYLRSYLNEGYNSVQVFELQGVDAIELEYLIKKSCCNHLYDFNNRLERGRTEIFYSNEDTETILMNSMLKFKPEFIHTLN